MTEPRGCEIECVTDPSRAGVLIHPLRLEILRQAREPASASEIAGRLGLPRQKVNYHVRELARRRFLRRAGRRRKRNMVEQDYVATAKAFVIAPQVIGPVAADHRQIEDQASAAHLVALSCQVQADLAAGLRQAEAEEKRLSTLSMVSDLGFDSAEQRAAFAAALREAVVDVVGRFASAPPAGDEEIKTRPYRLVVGCYPVLRRDAREDQGGGADGRS